MAIYDVTVDGFSLNTFGYNIDVFEGRRQIPGRANGGLSTALAHGIVPVMGAFEPSTYKIRMWVSSADSAGGTPTGTQYELNLDNIVMQFAKPGLLDIRMVMLNGTTRRAWSRLVGSVPIAETGGTEPTAGIEFVLENPYTFWEDPASLVTQSFTGTSASPWETMTSLVGSTAPIADAVFKVTGPVTTPSIQTVNGRITYNGSLAAGNAWIFDARKSISKVGPGISSITQGTSNIQNLDYSGSGGRLLDLWAPYQARLTGSGIAAGCTWSVTARKKFL